MGPVPENDHAVLAPSSPYDATLPYTPEHADAIAQLRGHEPHQTSGEGFLEGAAGELLPPRGMALRAPRHHPADLVDLPRVIAAARGDRAS